MTEQEALTILKNATANIPTTREQHLIILQALEVVNIKLFPIPNESNPKIDLKKQTLREPKKDVE